MLLHKKMAPAKAETISNKIFFCFFTVYLTGGTSSAADPQLGNAATGGDTQVTAKIDAPEPGEVTYVITIPEKVDFGTLTQPESDDVAHNKDISFTVTATEVNNLPEGSAIRVSVKDSLTTEDNDTFRLTQVGGSEVLTYDVYSKNPVEEGQTPINGYSIGANGFALVSFNGAGQSVTGTLRLDENQLFGKNLEDIAGEYAGTMSFYSEIVTQG